MKNRFFYLTGLVIVYGLGITFFGISDRFFSSQDRLFVHKVAETKKILQRYGSHSNQSGQARSIASIPPLKQSSNLVISDLADFYFSRARELIANGKLDQGLLQLSKVKGQSSNINLTMKASYLKSRIFCESKREKDCLKEIDFMISQSPESHWSGRALVLLARYYAQQSNLREVLLLKDVLLEQFKNDKIVMSELNQLNL